MLELFSVALVIGLGWVTAHAVANLFYVVIYGCVGAVTNALSKSDVE